MLPLISSRNSNSLSPFTAKERERRQMAEYFPHLFSPARIGNLEVRNRIAMPPMHLNFSRDGFASDREIEFYRCRARGGVGMIVIGAVAIDRVGGNPLQLRLDDDKYIPALARLSDAVRAEGARAAVQLYHAGRYNFSLATGGLSPIAPSPVPAKMFGGEVPREMTKEDIAGVRDAFARAAARAREAGFDAIQIHGSAGYLISQFISTVTNRRQDEYGGSFENRVRFPREVIEGVRRAVGRDVPIIMRITGADLVPGGLTNADMQQVCRAYVEAGADAIDVTGGWHESKIPQITMNVPPGAYVYLARGIREAVSVPVIASNRIHTPELAEELIRREVVDLVNMGRPLIADPELPRWAKIGRIQKIRPCIACNQGCFDTVFEITPVTCLLNPRAGREGEFPPFPPKAEQPKKVLVVGGGPAGMEAAATAAERGHQVFLWEERNRLGGQLDLCAAPPGRKEFDRILPYFFERMREAGVKVRINQKATVEKIQSLGPEVIIIATGSLPVIPPLPGINRSHVMFAPEVLRGEVWPQGRVVIIGGGATGLEVSHLLAAADTIDNETFRFLSVYQAEPPEELIRLATRARRPITVLEMLPRMGRDIGRSTRWSMLDEIRRSGVALRTGIEVRSITDSGVAGVEDGAEVFFPADSVIIAVGVLSHDAIFRELEEQRGFKVLGIGDASSPRKVIDAIREGYETAMEI